MLAARVGVAGTLVGGDNGLVAGANLVAGQRPRIVGQPGPGLAQTHTGESLDMIVPAEGPMLPEALQRIDRWLRGHRNDQAHAIDAEVIEPRLTLRAALGSVVPFHVISGYRFPAPNARLAAARGGVASNSRHLAGRAIDVRLPGVEQARLRVAAPAMLAGGVGF